MGKWVIAMVGLVAVMGVLLWQLQTDGPKKIHIQRYDAGPSVAIAASDARPVKPRVVRDGPKVQEEDAAVVKYDPQSEEFSHEVDVGIPDSFRAKLARCDRQGVDPDAKITINYRLHIDEGVVSASRVTVGKSNLENSTLEQCMVNAVEQGRWVAADMPDFMEDQELFIRIRSLNKYLDKDEQESAKEADQALD